MSRIVTHYDLSCWYINVRRLAELLGAAGVRDVETPPSVVERARSLAYTKDRVLEWLASSGTSTIGQLIVADRLKLGAVVTHFSNFYCKGLKRWRRSSSDTPAPHPLPELYSKIDDLRPGVRVSARYHPEHLVSSSAWSTLTGQTRLFLFGLVTDIKRTTIDISPYVIASVVHPDNRPTIMSGYLSSSMQVFPDSIDAFRGIEELRYPSEAELEILRSVSEETVKKTFAGILNESHVPKDWGGERSDLFTTRLTVRGERVAAAFAFKGPSHFKPLTLSGLGKNGDQIARLFSEPADLMVLQHCHRITPSVRATMRAFATQIGRLRLFCLIDGFDTLRILRAKAQCGILPASLKQPAPDDGHLGPA